MKTLLKQYLARRQHAAAWAAWHMTISSALPPRWWHRHLMHHEIFRAYMRQGRALQKDGFLL